MKLKITLLFLLLSFGVEAQQYQLFSAPAGKKIQLKWLSKSGKNGSFDIFRKEDNGSWQKLTTQPISPSPVITEAELKTAKNQFPKDSSYIVYIQYRNRKESTPNKQAFADYTATLAAVFDNRLAFHMGIFYEDEAVSGGRKYQYRLVDSASQKEWSVSTPIALGDTPNAPVDFKSVQEKQNLVFTWKVNDEFVGYNVYRNGKKVNEDAIFPNLEKQQTVVTFADQNIKPGNYKYVVKGITFLNTESKTSVELAIDVKDMTPPDGITGFKIERKGSELQLFWTPSKDVKAKGYFVYRSDDRGKTFRKITDVMLAATANQFAEKLKEDATGTIQYYIETCDAFGNKVPSIVTSVYVPDHSAPEMPKSVTAKSESGKITLSWIANTEKDLAGYRIYRGIKDDDENSMLLLNVKPQVATTFIDTFPKKAKTRFIYKVAAIDKAFNESAKANSWVVLPDVVPPAAPVLEQAVLKGNEVLLKWGLIVSDAILGYDVYRIFDNKKVKVNTDFIREGNFTDQTITQKGLYQYYVQAIDSARLGSKPSNNIYINTSQNKAIKEVKLALSQDVKTKKVQVELIGVVADEVQSAKLYRKDDSGFQALNYKFAAGAVTDETSVSGKIYEYFVEVTDMGDRIVRSETVIFNNP